MNARAATFRDLTGAVVGATWGGTICWFPRRPSKLVAVSERGDAEHVIRCGWCPGCRELDRRRLADRLIQWAAKVTGDLWLVIIDVPLRLQSTIAAKLKRTASLASACGFYRLDENSFAMIVAGRRPQVLLRRSLYSLKTSARRIARSRGRRAFNLVTSGILYSRDLWGQWRNRFYHRGLPRLERDRWLVSTAGGIRKRHAATGIGVRGVRGDVSLYPPAAWMPPRLARRSGPVDRRTRDPIQIGNVITDLLEQARRQPARGVQSPAKSRGGTPRLIPSGEIEVRTGRGDMTATPRPPLVPVVASNLAAGRTFLNTGSLRSNEAGYKGSRHLSAGDLDAWTARMLEIAKRRRNDRGDPDG